MIVKTFNDFIKCAKLHGAKTIILDMQYEGKETFYIQGDLIDYRRKRERERAAEEYDRQEAQRDKGNGERIR